MADRLNDQFIKGLKPPSKGNEVVFDFNDKNPHDKIRGFGIRITAAGVKSFIMNYRNVEGRQRRLTIGGYGVNQWTLAAARKRAGELRKMIDLGDDPLAERTSKRTAPTVADLCLIYEAEHLPKKRESSAAEDRRMIEKFIRPKFGNQKVATIHTSDIEALHLSLKNTPYMANRVLALTSKMFSLAMKRRKGEAEPWRTDNPCKGIERYYEPKRERPLKPREIDRLRDALDKHPNQKIANIVRLGMLTGCRRSEANNARWDQFDLEDGKWTKPGSQTKQKTLHKVNISAFAVELLNGILADAPKDDNGQPQSPFVFPGETDDKSLTWQQRDWDAIRKAAGLYAPLVDGVRGKDHARFVDCTRHTFATVMKSAGKSLELIGGLLGHTNPLTTARYAHLYDDPQREAADAVGNIITGAKSADVKPIRGDGAA